jgi:hypothetical protein
MLSHLLPKHVTIKVYKTITYLLVCKVVSLTLREQQKFMRFKNRVLRKIFGPKSPDITEGKCIVRRFLFELRAYSMGEQINENDDRSIGWLVS